MEGESFVQKALDIFDLTEEVYRLDAEELMRYAHKPPHSLFRQVKFQTALSLLVSGNAIQ